MSPQAIPVFGFVRPAGELPVRRNLFELRGGGPQDGVNGCGARVAMGVRMWGQTFLPNFFLKACSPVVTMPVRSDRKVVLLLAALYTL